MRFKRKFFENLDIKILNGRVIDGSGNPWFKADVGIENQRIVRIGELHKEDTNEVIDADGLIVAPGFIDSHSHSDLELLKNPFSPQKIKQGITTEILGQDGFSVAPIKDETWEQLCTNVRGLLGELDEDWEWQNLTEYFSLLEKGGIATNVCSHVGHATIRIYVMGFEDRAPLNEELNQMRKLVKQSMYEGAIGLSSGLVYPPSCYANTDELVELCKIVKENDGIYTSHIRGESYTLEKSMSEAIEIGLRSEASIHVSHHKASGRENWGKVVKTLNMIDKARSESVDLTCDQYPYTAGSTMLTVVLPPWALEGGIPRLLTRLNSSEVRERLKNDMTTGVLGWSSYLRAAGFENIMITYCKKNVQFEGKTLSNLAKELGKDPFDTVFDLLIDEEASISIVLFYLSEDDVKTVMRHQTVMVCTDGLLGGKPHPRVYGAFPRVLGRYVREEKKISIQDAVRKMTSLPAQRFGLNERGLIREGMYADITIFDPRTIIDLGTYTNPRQFPIGIEYVIVNGRLVLENGKQLDALPGTVLKKDNESKHPG
jgi:N-acyl-D-amino-acid deacylase